MEIESLPHTKKSDSMTFHADGFAITGGEEPVLTSTWTVVYILACIDDTMFHP